METITISTKDENKEQDTAYFKYSILKLLHPALILAVSFATAIAVFISKTELAAISNAETAVLKLIVGTALLFFIGYFFTYKLAAGRSPTEAQQMLQQNAEDIALMQEAFEAARQSGKTRAIRGKRPKARKPQRRGLMSNEKPSV